MDSIRLRPGRPRKFARPSRPVTVTLPEDVIAHLESADDSGDLGMGIVSLVERRRATEPSRATIAQVLRYGSHAVIIVPQLNALRRLPGVQLVPIGGGRALISLATPHSIPQLELAVRDAAEHIKADTKERDALKSVADILRKSRASRDVSLSERTIIVLEPKRRRRRG